MQHARDSKPGGVTDPGQATERRRLETVAITAQRKDATLRRKRLRRDTSAAELTMRATEITYTAEAVAEEQGISREPSAKSLGPSESWSEELMLASPPEGVEQQVQAAVDGVRSAKPVGGKQHLAAVRSLRQLLSNYAEPPYKAALAAGAVPALLAALQPPRLDATALEAVFEAAWAITNLAVGDAEVVKAVVPAAPLLITFLGGGSGLAVAEQSAWALGNIAGEDAEYRDILIANGAVRPLAGLLVRAAKALSSPSASSASAEFDPAISAGATAAWALANLLRGAGRHEVGEFMGSAGGPGALVTLIAAAPGHLAGEAAWVLAYVTASVEAHLNRMVALGVLPPLEARLVAAVEAQAPLADDAATRALLTPLLRALGNIVAGGASAAVAQLLAAEPALGAVQAVVACAQSHHHGLQREACWVLSNVAGVPGRGGVDAVKAAGAVPVLMQLLKEQPFHVRKEAAFAVANVCAGGGGGTGDYEALNRLFGGDVDALRAMLSLVRSADTDAARLGLQFTEMLLRLLPSGAKEVEAADGIDAIEALQFGEAAPAELQAAAAALVEQYWSVGGAEAEAQ